MDPAILSREVNVGFSGGHRLPIPSTPPRASTHLPHNLTGGHVRRERQQPAQNLGHFPRCICLLVPGSLCTGGERKLCEVLQLACLEPELAILDEIDSGGCCRVGAAGEGREPTITALTQESFLQLRQPLSLIDRCPPTGERGRPCGTLPSPMQAWTLMRCMPWRTPCRACGRCGRRWGCSSSLTTRRAGQGISCCKPVRFLMPTGLPEALFGD